MARIAFFGLGNMGAPMASNLMKHGHSLNVYDIAADAEKRLVGTDFRRMDTPAQAARDAEAVITVLPTSQHVDHVILGPDGAASTMSPGTMLIDCTTASPAASMALAGALAERAIRMVDATLGRPPWSAIDGTMLFMLGGRDEDIAAVRPILECMGTDFIHCGAQGSGAKVKAINNYMSVIGMVVAAEALAFGRRAGVDRDILMQVLRSTVAGRGAINVLYPEKVLKGDVSPLFSMRLAHKDLGVALGFGAELGMPLGVGAAGREVLSLGNSLGRFDQDVTALLLALEELDKIDCRQQPAD